MVLHSSSSYPLVKLKEFYELLPSTHTIRIKKLLNEQHLKKRKKGSLKSAVCYKMSCKPICAAWTGMLLSKHAETMRKHAQNCIAGKQKDKKKE